MDVTANRKINWKLKEVREMIHKFEIKTEVLSQLFEIVSALVDEVNVQVGKKGWEIQCVDPAHVAMLDVRVAMEVFDSYQYKDRKILEVGIDLDKMKAILKLCKEHDITMFEGEVVEGKFKREDGEHYDIIAQIGDLKRVISGVDVAVITQAKIPKMAEGIEREVKVKDLVFALKNAELVTDHIELIMDRPGMEIRAAGDFNSIEMLLNIEGDKEPQRSMFSLDYLSEGIRVVPTETIKMEMGTDHPLTISYDFVDKGIKVKYLLAPRIESE